MKVRYTGVTTVSTAAPSAVWEPGEVKELPDDADVPNNPAFEVVHPGDPVPVARTSAPRPAGKEAS